MSSNNKYNKEIDKNSGNKINNNNNNNNENKNKNNIEIDKEFNEKFDDDLDDEFDEEFDEELNEEFKKFLSEANKLVEDWIDIIDKHENLTIHHVLGAATDLLSRIIPAYIEELREVYDDKKIGTILQEYIADLLVTIIDTALEKNIRIDEL
ncbi:MAG: hypothetical protein ACTSRP_11485 [Candidatus Helarchaeota archaeon]